MATKWFILLFAVFAFAASLPSSSSSSKETTSSSSSLKNSSKATCCSTSSPVTFETTGKTQTCEEAAQICRQAAKIRLSNCFSCYLALVNAKINIIFHICTNTNTFGKGIFMDQSHIKYVPKHYSLCQSFKSKQG